MLFHQSFKSRGVIPSDCLCLGHKDVVAWNLGFYTDLELKEVLSDIPEFDGLTNKHESKEYPKELSCSAR